MPFEHLSYRFSLSRFGADFTDADVEMRLDGSMLSTTVVSRNGGFGDPAIVFEVDFTGSGVDQTTADQTVSVVVTGVDVEGTVMNYDWETIVIHPDMPMLESSPSVGLFGEMLVGYGSTPHTFTISNTGAVVANIGGVEMRDTDARHFRVTDDRCSGATLPVGAECTVEAVFAPQAAGSFSARLNVLFDGVESPFRLAFYGTGTDDPPAPSDVSATALSSSEILLEWTDVPGYRVRRWNGSTYASIAGLLDPGTMSQTDTGLAADGQYGYKVCTVGGSIERCSTQVIVTTLPYEPPPLFPPEDVEATGISDSEIRLTWTDIDGEDGYRIRRADPGFVLVGTVGAGVEEFIDSGLDWGATYYYRVCSYLDDYEDCDPEPVKADETLGSRNY